MRLTEGWTFACDPVPRMASWQHRNETHKWNMDFAPALDVPDAGMRAAKATPLGNHILSPLPYAGQISRFCKQVWETMNSTNGNLWGRSGRGRCRNLFEHVREIYANFLQNFRILSWHNEMKFCKVSADFPQEFLQRTLCYDPISEPLINGQRGHSKWEVCKFQDFQVFVPIFLDFKLFSYFCSFGPFLLRVGPKSGELPDNPGLLSDKQNKAMELGNEGSPPFTIWKLLKGKNPEGKYFRKLLKRKHSSAKMSKIPEIPSIQQNWYLLSSEKSSNIPSANKHFFCEVFSNFYPLRFDPLARIFSAVSQHPC